MEITLLLLEQSAQPRFYEIEDFKSSLDILVIETNQNIRELSDVHLSDLFFKIRFDGSQIRFKSR